MAFEITSGISCLVQQFFLGLLKGGDAVVAEARKKSNRMRPGEGGAGPQSRNGVSGRAFPNSVRELEELGEQEMRGDEQKPAPCQTGLDGQGGHAV
jgi:hypothetical protein